MIGKRGKEENWEKGGGGKAIRLQDCIESPPFLCIQSNLAILSQFSQFEPGLWIFLQKNSYFRKKDASRSFHTLYHNSFLFNRTFSFSNKHVMCDQCLGLVPESHEATTYQEKIHKTGCVAHMSSRVGGVVPRY